MFKGFWSSSWGEIFRVLIISLIIIIPFRAYVAQPFLVSGPSMDNTFHNGEYLIVDQLTYENRDPHRGEVVIFKYPLDNKKYFIERVIGLPGETIKIQGDQVLIINQVHPKGLKLIEPYVNPADLPPRPDISVALGPDEYFVLGDNRAVSSDSRIWGPVKRELITGRPFLRLLPLTEISVFPGQVADQS